MFTVRSIDYNLHRKFYTVASKTTNYYPSVDFTRLDTWL